VTLVSEDEVARLPGEVHHIRFGDFDFQVLTQTFETYGIRLDDLDAIAVGVFDHGNAPKDISDRKYRFEYLKQRVLQENRLGAFAYRSADIPLMLTRMQAVADSARDLPCPLILMDTAPAAVLGATFDPLVRTQTRRLIVNLGNMHTLSFRLGESGIEGIFEHHTTLLSMESLDDFLQKFIAGTLTNEEVYASQGHGAYLKECPAWSLDDPQLVVAVTGPRRGLMRSSRRPVHFAAPFGDMMLCGCYGLLAAAAELFPQLAGEINAALNGNLETQSSPWEIE
jgi:uncharacterized protein (DUF1786 family)